MKLVVVFVSFVFLLTEFDLALAAKEESSDKVINVVNLTTLEILKKYGYPGESHVTESKDGYILELHRIPFGRNSSAPRRKTPILIMHGFLGNSAMFLLAGPKNCFPCLVADLGYDVWLGNVRGNRYSKGHRYFSTDDRRFWDFSWHETGIYDIPAHIDYISSHTGQKKILYIGYSMGTTQFFVMASQRPEYQKKLIGAVLFAPVAYLKHTECPLRLLSPHSRLIRVSFEILENGKLLDTSPMFKKLALLLCTMLRIQEVICRDLIFLMDGKNKDLYNPDVIPNFLTHFPDASSIRSFVHFLQLIRSGKFCPYDHGVFKNRRLYGSFSPPDYKLESIKTPVSLFVGSNDLLTEPRDLQRLMIRLPNIKSLDYVKHENFTHRDFLLAKGVKTLVYDLALKRVVALINEENKKDKNYLSKT